MYELMFGITGSPFRLTPDPAFYFDGQGHRSALESLRRGVFQRSGFTVLTGDIGAGKTTLLHTLIDELVAGGIVVGKVVNTQLDANELLVAAATAFGRSADGGPLHTVAQSLFDFFARLSAVGKSAVLAVDEAHNLSQQALLQLAQLSTAASAQRVPFHVLLVGQPELRALIESETLAPLKKEIRNSSHLGPLAAGEVRSYVEHRLRTVNWAGNPAFATEAFDEIFRWTEGVPRRINLLCNRLLLSRFLATSSLVSAATVIESAEALRDEIGAPESASTAMVDLMTSTSTHRDGEPAAGVGVLSGASATEALHTGPGPISVRMVSAAEMPKPVLCVVAAEDDFFDAAALIRAMERGPINPPALLLRVFGRDKEKQTLEAFGESGETVLALDLDLRRSAVRVHGGELRQRFIAACEEVRPSAVVVFQTTDASLVCAIAARQRRIPVVSVGPAARERRQQAVRDEFAKKIWLAIHPAPDLRP